MMVNNPGNGVNDVSDVLVFERGQIYHWNDPIYLEKNAGYKIDSGEVSLRYSRYVLIIQNIPLDVYPRSIVVLPFSTANNDPNDVKIIFSDGKETYVKCGLPMPVSPNNLGKYKGRMKNMERIDGILSKLLLDIPADKEIEKEEVDIDLKSTIEHVTEDSYSKVETKPNKVEKDEPVVTTTKNSSPPEEKAEKKVEPIEPSVQELEPEEVPSINLSEEAAGVILYVLSQGVINKRQNPHSNDPITKYLSSDNFLGKLKVYGIIDEKVHKARRDVIVRSVDELQPAIRKALNKYYPDVTIDAHMKGKSSKVLQDTRPSEMAKPSPGVGDQYKRKFCEIYTRFGKEYAASKWGITLSTAQTYYYKWRRMFNEDNESSNTPVDSRRGRRTNLDEKRAFVEYYEANGATKAAIEFNLELKSAYNKYHRTKKEFDRST